VPLEDDHHHCKVCGAVCAPSAMVCSTACGEKRERMVAQRRRLQYVLYAAMLIALLVLSLELRF